MAFVLPESTTRLVPPADLGFTADEWIEIRAMWTVGMRQRFWKNLLEAGHRPEQPVDALTSRRALLPVIVAGWSDSEPVTPEALDSLPPEVADWIAEEYDRIVAGRSEDERKNLDDASSPISDQGAEDSPLNLPTSMKRNGSGITA